MCDCYIAKCGGCGRDISLHIAGYCTPRANVEAFCQECVSRKLLECQEGLEGTPQIFVDVVESDGEDAEVAGGHRGDLVVILCRDPKAYGITVNRAGA